MVISQLLWVWHDCKLDFQEKIPYGGFSQIQSRIVPDIISARIGVTVCLWILHTCSTRKSSKILHSTFQGSAFCSITPILLSTMFGQYLFCNYTISVYFSSREFPLYRNCQSRFWIYDCKQILELKGYTVKIEVLKVCRRMEF